MKRRDFALFLDELKGKAVYLVKEKPDKPQRIVRFYLNNGIYFTTVMGCCGQRLFKAFALFLAADSVI